MLFGKKHGRRAKDKRTSYMGVKGGMRRNATLRVNSFNDLSLMDNLFTDAIKKLRNSK